MKKPEMTQISSLLIANRGEIALRVMRTAKARGLRTIAVYSEADADALHVQAADEAICIGPAPAAQSYLAIDRIISAMAQANADAVHPGYGFLSENAAFAKAVVEAGRIFVGPPEKAIDVMGDKARAKRAMIEAGVPCVPGYQGQDQSDQRLIKEASAIGFPVMVKAAAGGGGRGMRLVRDARDLPDALTTARSEAQNAFGAGDLIIEKAIIEPRHVEIQVFADAHGNCIHLGERDCSVQRRHQKVVEEAPCPVMTQALRQQMGNAAVEAAKAVDYRGAGTVEFLLDGGGNFYFLEMNTRLQVEHPVTEEVTGLDLVALQLDVAMGKPLPLQQSDVSLTGHSIEVRLYAEDVAGGFLPSTGRIDQFVHPEGPGIRVDAGVASGFEVSPHYDPMVAKIIATADTRESARRRLITALENTALAGPATNRDFLIDILKTDAFACGQATTGLVETMTIGPPAPTARALAAGAVIQFCLARAKAQALALGPAEELINWSSTGRPESLFLYGSGDDQVVVRVCPEGPHAYRVLVAEQAVEVLVSEFSPPRARLRIDGSGRTALFHAPEPAALTLFIGDRTLKLVNGVEGKAAGGEAVGTGAVFAPMHGQLVSLHVAEGAAVNKGDKLAVLEAMKMQHSLIAPVSGTVAEVTAEEGTQVAAGDLILRIEEATS